MIIEKVVKKNEKNVIVFFDNDDKLILSYEIFLKNGLKKNEDISDSRLSSLIEQNQIYFLKQKAYRLLGRRQHSSYELKIKLRQKGYKSEFIEQIIEELNSKGLLNDYEFALAFSEESITNKSWGKKKVEAELFKRGVDRGVISEIIEEKFPEGSGFDKALELGRKKMKLLQARKAEPEKLSSKLYSFLLSKGYDYESCKRVVEALTKELS